MAQDQKIQKQNPDEYAQRGKTLGSSARRLRGWVGSDPSRTAELADVLVELTAHRLLGHSYAAAASDAQDAVRLAAQLLTANGPIGPYTAAADAIRYITAVVHLATIQVGAGLPEAAGRTIESLQDLRQTLSELRLDEHLTPQTAIWALSATARAALAAGEPAQANAYADAALDRLTESGLRNDPGTAYLALDVDRLASDCRWAAGRTDEALTFLHRAKDWYEQVVAGRLHEPARYSPALVERLAEPLFGLYRDLADRLAGTGEADLGLVTRRTLVELLQGLTARLGDPARVQLRSALADLAGDLLAADRVEEAVSAAAEAAAIRVDRTSAGSPPLLVAAVQAQAVTRAGRAAEAVASLRRVLPAEAGHPPSAAHAAGLLALADALRADGELEAAASAERTLSDLTRELLPQSTEGNAARTALLDLARGVVSRGVGPLTWSPLSSTASYATTAAESTAAGAPTGDSESKRETVAWLDAERAEAHRMELERLELARIEAERRKAERIEAERIAAETLAAERARVEAAEGLEAERRAVAEERERLERRRRREERLEEHRLEVERREAEAREARRLEAERLAERLATDPDETERRELERLQAELAALEPAAEAAATHGGQAEELAAERDALERENAERREVERAEAERIKAQRVEAERAEAQRVEAERVEAERVEAERVEAERVEAERVEAQRVDAEQAEAQRVEAQRVEAQRVEAERAEAQRVEAERAEAQRVEAERIEAERIEAERAEAERIEAQHAEAQRVEAEQAEAEQAEAEQAEAEQAEAQRVEAEQVEAQRAEAQRVEAERAEAQRVEAQRVEAERIEAERAEAERIEAERAEAERIAAQQAEAQRVEAQQAEAQRAEAERIQAQRIEAQRALAEQAEAEQEAAAQAERREAEEADELASVQRLWRDLRAQGDRRGARAANERVVELLRSRAASDLAAYGWQLQSALEELSSARLRSGDVWGSRAPAKEAKALAKTLGQ